MSPDDDPELAAIRARLMADLMSQAPSAEPAAEREPEGPPWPDRPIDVTDADFENVVRRYPLALVDFWAPWCGPCRVVAPSVEALAKELAGKVAFLKLNTDESPRVSQAYRIQSIPTMLVFRNGEAVDGLVGAQPKPAIAAALRRHLGERRGTPGPRRR